jgi:hypothetical protein
MDTTLKNTVSRRLDRTRYQDQEAAPSASTEQESEAIEGAVAAKRNIEAAMLWAYREGVSHTTDLGRSIEIPKIQIPALPIFGMERADGIDAEWRSLAHDFALKLLAEIAPGYQGLLETAVPDAAHAAQRAIRTQADAKKRGGSGGQKVRKAGTEEPDEDPGCIDAGTLVDERLTPQQEIEDQEEKAESQNDAERAMRIALERWGPSGRRMLEALAEGQTGKKAAEAAGISAPALIKRRKTLAKLLKD